MAYIDILNAVARVVGGSQPTAAQVAAGSGIDVAQQPYWWSGVDAIDGSGVSGLAGCYSMPQAKLELTPVGMVLPFGWKPTENFPTQGKKYPEEEVRVRILTGHADIQSQMALLANFRDLVEDAFDHHMTLFNTANVDTAWCSTGQFLEVELPVGTVYLALEFVVKIWRSVSITYS